MPLTKFDSIPNDIKLLPITRFYIEKNLGAQGADQYQFFNLEAESNLKITGRYKKDYRGRSRMLGMYIEANIYLPYSYIHSQKGTLAFSALQRMSFEGNGIRATIMLGKPRTAGDTEFETYNSNSSGEIYLSNPSIEIETETVELRTRTLIKLSHITNANNYFDLIYTGGRI